MAEKSGPKITVTKGVGEEKTVVVSDGEKYTTTDEGTFIRIMSPFGMSSNEAAVNRKGVNIDTIKGKINAGAGDYGWLERSYIGLRSILGWLVLGIILLFGATFIPIVGPIAATLFSMLPFLGGLYERITQKKKTKAIVDSVQVAKDSLLPDDRATFNARMAENQDKEIEKLVKELK